MLTTEFNIEALPVKIDYVAEVFKEDWGTSGSKVDQWSVTIGDRNGSWRTDYFTGLGLRTPIAVSLLGNNPPRRGTLAWESLEKTRKPVKPKVADVLHSLFMDARAAQLNFSDWCSEYGYSDDSIKALNTYKQCIEIATRLRKYFSSEQRAAIEAVIEEM